VEESVVASLRRLRLEALSVCLFHIEQNFAYIKPLLRLQERGLVQHVGCSVMTPEGTATILDTGLADALQIPTGVLDRRYSRPDGGLIGRAARAGAAVFVRSIYLQGLLLMPEEEIPPQLAEVIGVRRRLAALAREAGMTLAELAVRYVLGLPGVIAAVVGVETLGQLRENLQMFDLGPLPGDVHRAAEAAVPELPGRILMPNHWPKRMEVTPLGAQAPG
jgi:aryl-alcohol dehydrogenase-like predicted oxidoreductase